MTIFFVKWLWIYIYFFNCGFLYSTIYISIQTLFCLFLWTSFPAGGDFSETLCFSFWHGPARALPILASRLCVFVWALCKPKFSAFWRVVSFSVTLILRGSKRFHCDTVVSKTYPAIPTTTHRCCRSQHRRWAPPASCHGSAPWSPDRSCRWGWAPPPAGRRQDGRKGKEKRGETAETVSQLSQHNCTDVNNKVSLCVPSQWTPVCVCLCVNKSGTAWKLQRRPKAATLGW